MEQLNKNPNSLQEGVTGWEQVAEVQQKTPEQLSRERQERKTIGFLISGGDTRMISAPDVAISEEMRGDFLRDMAAGEYGEETEVDFLNRIRGPIDTPENGAGGGRIFEKIMSDPWQKQLFSFCTGAKVDGLENGGETVRQFLTTTNEHIDLTTPVGFEKMREQVLGFLKPQVSDQEMFKYAQSMDDLELTLYGKKFEYYQAFEGLREEAAMLTPLAPGTPQPTGGEGLSYLEKPARAVEVFDVEEAVGEELLRRAKINGDAWVQNGQSYQLRADSLKEAGLMPSHQIVVDGQTICLSDVFELQDGRWGSIAYIPTAEGGVAVRGYYRSNSQGAWRYMPDYVKSANSGHIEWYGKSSNEEAMTLPFEIQAGLAQVEQGSGLKKITTMNPDFLLAGTAKHYATKGEYKEKMAAGEMRGDYYEEVAASANTELFEASTKKKQAPENLRLNSTAAPDFGRKVMEYEGSSALAGKTRVEVFASKDGRLNYLMCSDEEGRSWVGGVETCSPITSTGLRRDWAIAGDLATPLYEYEQQTDGYGDTEDVRGRYQGMWKNYLSRVPIIQDYQKVRELRGSQK